MNGNGADSSRKRSKISIFLTEEQMKAGRGAAMIALWFWEFPPTQVLLPSLYVNQDTFFKPIVTRGPNVAELIEEYRETGNVMPRHLADLLAAIAVLHEAFGEDMPSAFQSANVRPIPDEVVAFVIAALIGEWSLGKRNAERTKKAKDLKARRDALMQQRGLSKLEAARRVIAQDYPGLAETSPEFVKRRETLRKK